MEDVLSPAAGEASGALGADDERNSFRPLQLLAELKEKAQQPSPSPLPDRLPWRSIKQLPELFQPRGPNGTDEKHVQDLKRGLEVSKELEPVLVAWIGPDAYLIDGHHRMLAYQLARRAEPIPVASFIGSVDAAILAAGEANSRAKLPMSTRERMDYGWRLVLMGKLYTKGMVVKAAGVSDRQVALMRRAAKDLGPDAFAYREWWQAQQAAKGKSSEPLTDDEQEAKLDAMAGEWADKLAKAFSTKLAQNPELAARALSHYFGRNLKQLVRHLSDQIDDDGEDDDSDF
ncbi:ParB N-terminal domain-containing protein [Kaistia sp. MMO-174]|uniref:ParB N-terminal domain-containing protein n=1 Tax=Kaistia sp. MMO-174 TaxID=3081256 RepID=UPI0030193B10